MYNCKHELIAVASLKNKLFELSVTVAHKTTHEPKTNISPTVTTNKEKCHRTLSHVNFHDLKSLCEAQILEGLPHTIKNEYLKCYICLKNKITNIKI